ncbi:MAG: antibiotic biosynthesis monooxygenase [Candidatus Nanopelagicales bacterium]|jgi:heme-degrading monooxygenase HmoA|nr:antibiotic biosynthesis monooxygenase [Candidatus Nanopelagicales bacterium]
MPFVAINVLTVPESSGATLEERFARRAGSVERAPGFERFELLRPIEGTDAYLVYTRWASRADFEAWTTSQAFAGGHGQASGRSQAEPRAATASTIWSFEVVQVADPLV